MKQSLLQDYMSQYGQKLRSALFGTNAVIQPPPNDSPIQNRDQGRAPYVPPQDPMAPTEPGGTTDPNGGDDMGGPSALSSGSDGMEPQDPGMSQDSALDQKGKGLSFRDAWDKTSKDTRDQQVTKLEETLKRGNQTIDSAYDELVKKLGAPPDKNRKLSRDEKGMLLMEFGLSMLANSRKGLATAAGEAGGQTFGSYAQMKVGPQQNYDSAMASIEAARARDKTNLATTSALESVKAKSPGGALPGKFIGDDGFVYFYGQDGTAQKALDENGKPIKGQVNKGGENGRGFESDAKYSRYMEIYGVDPNSGKPLTGLALQRAKQDALEFANDRGSTIDDLDLDIIAENSADKEMGADAYQDMTPEQRSAQRNKIASERRGRLKKKTRSYLETTEPRRGTPSGGIKKSFATQADAQAAYNRGEIQKGDRIRVAGVEGPVE